MATTRGDQPVSNSVAGPFVVSLARRPERARGPPRHPYRVPAEHPAKKGGVAGAPTPATPQ
jgi:hypothetical protein